MILKLIETICLSSIQSSRKLSRDKVKKSMYWVFVKEIESEQKSKSKRNITNPQKGFHLLMRLKQWIKLIWSHFLQCVCTGLPVQFVRRVRRQGERCGAHLANFDKKVHKPQYCTLVIARVKKAKHAEKLSNYLVSK